MPVTDTPAERLARGGGWWTLILALLMLLAVTESLTTAAWSDGLAVVRYAILGGALLAFALALTRWDGIFPAIYGFLASLFWIATCFNWFVFQELSPQAGVQELLRRNWDWLAALFTGQGQRRQPDLRHPTGAPGLVDRLSRPVEPDAPPAPAARRAPGRGGADRKCLLRAART